MEWNYTGLQLRNLTAWCIFLGDPGAVGRVGRKGGTKVFKYGRKSPWVPTLTELFPKIQADAGSWLGTKNALYYCAQSANSFSWVLFVSSPDQSDCPWVSEDADEPTLLFTNLTKGFVQIFESKIRDVFQNNISFSGLK